MQAVRPPRHEGWPEKMAGDKGFSYPSVRRWLARRGIEAVIPRRGDEPARDSEFGRDGSSYRCRSVAEQCVGWLKECRRVGTRFDKLASAFLSFVKPANIQPCLRTLDPSDRS